MDTGYFTLIDPAEIGRCSEVLTLDIGDEHWLLACTAAAGHEGQHSSVITWGSAHWSDWASD